MVSCKEYFDDKYFKERIEANIQTVAQIDNEGDSFIYRNVKYYYLMYNIIVDSFFNYVFYDDVEGMMEKESDRDDEVVCVWWSDKDDDITEEKSLEFIEKCKRRWDKMIEGSSGDIWDKYDNKTEYNNTESNDTDLHAGNICSRGYFLRSNKCFLKNNPEIYRIEISKENQEYIVEILSKFGCDEISFEYVYNNLKNTRKNSLVYWKDGKRNIVKDALWKYLVYEFEDLKISEKIKRIEILDEKEFKNKYEI